MPMHSAFSLFTKSPVTLELAVIVFTQYTYGYRCDIYIYITSYVSLQCSASVKHYMVPMVGPLFYCCSIRCLENPFVNHVQTDVAHKIRSSLLATILIHEF